MSNFIKWTLLLTMLYSIASCKKYLDKKPSTSIVTPSTLRDLQALLDRADDINYNTPGLSYNTTDEFFTPDAVLSTLDPNDRDLYLWKPIEYRYLNDWSKAYYPVYVANLSLERLETITRETTTEAAWNNVKGQALFVRSFYFLRLAWTFAKGYNSATAESDLGIPVRTISDFNVTSSRGNLKQTYDRILQDAKDAALYLPDLPQHVMRPSKAAAYGLLAEAYLSMNQFDSAFKYSNASLQIKSNLIDLKDPSVNVNAAAPFAAFNAETIFYSRPYHAVFAGLNGYGYVDTSIYSSFSANDLRKAAYFTTPVSGYYSFKGSYTGNQFFYFTGIATDEMYLIRAEGNARAGNTAAALNDLNTLLAKKYTATFVPLTAATSQEALTLVLNERKKELLFRGFRWSDLKRFNLLGANITPKRIVAGQTITLPPNDLRYALPLPLDIVEQGLPQNPY